MATRNMRHASVYWGSATPTRVAGTRRIRVGMESDFIEDTAHGSANKTFAPTFVEPEITVEGLYDTASSPQVIRDALAANLGKFSIYLGASTTYFYGSGYASVNEVGAPYDDFGTFEWSIKPAGTLGFYST